MSQKTTVQPKNKAARSLVSGRLGHTAVRSIPDQSIPSAAMTSSSFGQDLSQVPTGATPSANGLQRIAFGPPPVQTKLRIGEPGDKYEQEADRIADQVMRMPQPQAIQDTELSEGDQASAINGQRRVAAQAEQIRVPPIVYDVLRSPGQPLDPADCLFMESRFDQDFSRVRVHTDALACSSAQSLHASAYTVGNDIVMASGAYAPSTAAGRRLLAHELTHVIQQRSHGQRVQCWGGPIHKEVTEIASDVIADEDVIPVAAGKSEFVAKLKPYSISTDYKARRIMWTAPLFLSGAVEGEGPDHGEDGNYSSTDVGAARAENVRRQQEYIDESVGYYRQFVSSRGKQREQGGPAIDRSDIWDVLSKPGLGAIGGAIGGTMYGYAAAAQVSKAVGGGFWGGLLGALTGLVTVPLGLSLGTAAGALGVGAAVSVGKSRPATNARDGVFAALGDACHVAQDRASHWEGVKGFGHSDPKTQHGWSPDDKEDNKGDKPGDFGGFKIAIRNTREVFKEWISSVRGP